MPEISISKKFGNLKSFKVKGIHNLCSIITGKRMLPKQKEFKPKQNKLLKSEKDESLKDEDS